MRNIIRLEKVTKNEIENLKLWKEMIDRGSLGEVFAAGMIQAFKNHSRLLRTQEGRELYQTCHTKIKGTHWEDHFDGVDELRENYGKLWRQRVGGKIHAVFRVAEPSEEFKKKEGEYVVNRLKKNIQQTKKIQEQIPQHQV